MHHDAPPSEPSEPEDAADRHEQVVDSPSSGPSGGGLVIRRLVVMVVLLGVAGAAAYMLHAARPRVAERSADSVRPVVQSFVAQRVPVAQAWSGQGTARALHSADVPARVAATVVGPAAAVRPGTRVTLGQVLVQLDEEEFVRRAEVARQRMREIDASLAQLEVEQKRMAERTALDDSDVAMARTEFDRQTRLHERGVTTEQDIDVSRRILIAAQRSELATRQAAELIGPRRRQLEALRAGQEAQEKLAELDRQRATINSPLAGVVQALDVEVGESVAVGQRVARVVALDRVEVPVSLPAAAAGSVAVGDTVTLWTAGSELSAWESTVLRVAPEQDTATRTLTVYAEVSSADDGTPPPPPGVFLDARVQTADAQLRWVVPRRSLREGRVQVIVDGRLVSRAAQVAFYVNAVQPALGIADDQWAVIDEVLAPGDRVLIDAANRLPDGTEVLDAAGTPTDTPPVAPASDDDADAGVRGAGA